MCIRSSFFFFFISSLIATNVLFNAYAQPGLSDKPVEREYDYSLAASVTSTNTFDLIRHINVNQIDRQSNQVFNGFLQQKALMNDVVNQLEAQGLQAAHR